MPDDLIREDIPLTKIKVADQYGDLIEGLTVGQSMTIATEDRVRVLQYVKTKYKSDRIFSTTTFEGKLYLQRLQ